MDNKRKSGEIKITRSQSKTEYNKSESSRIFRNDLDNRTSNRRSRSESGYDPIRPGSSYGTRRVSERSRTSGGVPQTEKKERRVLNDAEKKRRAEQKRKKERLRLMRLRAIAGVIALTIITIILLFMTPLFDIREIRLEGNNLVNKEDIVAKIGNLPGENLFGTSKKKIEKSVCDIPLVKGAKVDKNIFPPYITITITECPPAAYMLSGNRLIVIDSNLKVIDDSNSFNTDEIPSVSGVSVASYELNKNISTESKEKDEILRRMLQTLESVGLTNYVTYISINDITSIKFNYQNRIEVLCGSQLELNRKIRMFAETINSKELSDNAMGTIDLSVPGQAVYTP